MGTGRHKVVCIVVPQIRAPQNPEWNPDTKSRSTFMNWISSVWRQIPEASSNPLAGNVTNQTFHHPEEDSRTFDVRARKKLIKPVRPGRSLSV